MKFSCLQKWMVSGLLFLACFSTSSWAVRNGETAYSGAYAAVIGLTSKCSAVVIHPRALLTAAHCSGLLNERENNTVYFSSLNSGTDVVIQKIYVDPFYEEAAWGSRTFAVNDDFALVILKDPIRDANVVAHIPRIISDTSLSDQDTMMAVGFGVYRTTAHVVDDNKARRKANYRLEKIKGSVFFLRTLTPYVGACSGDSGGGFLRVSPDGKNSELVGILTAQGGICGDPDQYDNAESVFAHLSWIKQNLLKEGIALE
jgi:secreted trypsin-like serine protease